METPYAVVRGDNDEKVRIALHDLQRHAELGFLTTPRRLSAKYADSVLENVMGVKLRATCGSASIVKLDCCAGEAIDKVRRIHPPAHVLIVSNKHAAYGELAINY